MKQARENRSEKALLDRRRRLLADLVEMLREKQVGTLAAELEQPIEKFASYVQLARHPQSAHLVFRLDTVDQHLLELAIPVKAAFDQSVHEIYGAHLAHQAR